ncbi:hypothetical protein D3C80_1175490 [compost metagenome]
MIAVQRVKIAEVQQPIRARRMEKGPLSTRLGHNLRHRGHRRFAATHPAAVDLVLRQHLQNIVTIGIAADQPQRRQRQPGFHTRQRQQYIKRRTAGGTLAMFNLHQPARLRPMRNLMDMIHQHVTGRNNATPAHHNRPALPKICICCCTTSLIERSTANSTSANSS